MVTSIEPKRPDDKIIRLPFQELIREVYRARFFDDRAAGIRSGRGVGASGR